MKFHQTFNVVPSLPEGLKPLRELAYNYWWGWNADAFNVFRHIDPDGWTDTRHNPVKFISQISQERLDELVHDEGFMYHLNRVVANLNSYLTRKTWFQGRKLGEGFRVAYFSAEFGISEGLPIYAGGLGVLAGDHLKSASDLGVPLVGVGLAYRQGYFRQYLTQDGWQQERFVENDFYNMPMIQERDAQNQPLVVELDFPGRKVLVQVWRVQVGRIPLYLMDTNVDGNTPYDRNITAQLYGGDQEMRLQQEIVLGIGGIRALEKLGWYPAVTHMNEGHSAFLALERIAQHMEKDNLTYEEAREIVAASSMFTTHTPVPAGIDMFGPDMVEKYFSGYYKKFGITLESFLSLGRVNPGNHSEPFSMAILALHLSTKSNGVARLHGIVSRKMWRDLWPELPLEDVPISHVTNGVHVNSWISAEMSELFDRYLGPRWLEEPGDQRIWERISEIPSAELWRTHERRRERLVGYVRRRLHQQLQDRGLPREEVEMADQVLDPEALTIGFARRFATYKRANLIFRDIDRLVALATNKNRPVQIIFAGKAHPNDEPGKRLIQEVVRIGRRGDLRRHIVFLEDYDLNCAHYLLQGIDVWLNNPRRPLEASGTSGMKAVFNGGLNCSILDGWWDEGYNGENGWAIGRGEEYADNEYQDRVESAALYQILENELIPLFYDRGPDGIPEKWIQRMKKSMTSLGPVFNTNRMVTEYTEGFYIPEVERLNKLKANNCEGARNLAAWKTKIAGAWESVRIEKVEGDMQMEFPVGSELPVRASIVLGALSPEDILVEIYYGLVDGEQNIYKTHTVVMKPEKTVSNNRIVFTGAIPCSATGRHGFTVRVVPNHPDLTERFEMNLVVWA
jgi:starch phosphorylase